MRNSSLGGIIPYLPTPLVGTQIHRECVEQLVEDLIGTGVSGLSPLGSTGEIMYLTREQRIGMVEAVVESASGRVPVVVGVAGFSVAEVCEQIRHFENAGADGFVVILQRYFPLSIDEQYEYFARAAATTELPIVVYSNPLLGADISTDLAVKLAQIENVRYLKDASSNTGKLYSIINRAGSQVKIFAASAHVPALVFELGGIGWMAGPACVAPRAAVQMWQAWQAGDRRRMWQLQEVLWPLNEMFSRFSAASFIKYALAEQGYPVGTPCAPKGALDHSEIGDLLTQAMGRIEEILATPQE